MEEINFIGSKTIETEHFILRKFKETDGDAMFKNWASDPDVARYVTWEPHESVEVSNNLCKIWAEECQKNNVFKWAMELKDTGEIIGDISVVHIEEQVKEAVIGYCMGKKWWRNGYMTECFMAVIKFLFEEANFNRISAEHHIMNPASGKVMKKCGLLYEYTKRQGAFMKGELFDVCGYAILKSDYEEKSKNPL